MSPSNRGRDQIRSALRADLSKPLVKTMFKHDLPLASDERRQRRLAREQRLDDAYAKVDTRDKGVSWVTGRATVKGSPDARNRRERHHLRGRRVMPEWKYDPDHIITVTAEEHALITNGKLDVEGDDATKPIFFHWNCAPTYRPFEILPVRLRKQAREQAVIAEDED
jgi:hypothetical protein